MVETANLHTKHTADNSQFKATMTESIGLVDRFGNKLINQKAVETAAISKSSREYDRLRRSIDPVYSASKKYEGELAKLNGLLKTGTINTAQFTTMNKQLSAGLLTTAGAANLMTGSVRNSRFHTANLGAQFNDIGVMLAAGQSPLMLAVQQGTQISQVFAAMGGTPLDNVKAMGAGIRAMLSPMSLMTIGAIAGLAVLVQWGRAAWEAADGGGSAFEEKLKEINEQLADSERRILAYNNGLSQIGSQDIADEIDRTRDAINQLNASIAAIEAMGSEGLSRSLQTQRDRIPVMREQLAILNETLTALETEAARVEAAKTAFENTVTPVEMIKTIIEGTEFGLTTLVGLAEKLSDNAWDAAAGFGEVLREMAIANVAAEQSQLGRGGMGAGGPTSAAGRFEAMDGIFVNRDNKNAAAGGGGGGGAVDPLTGQLTALGAQLQTPLEKEQEQFAERQKILEEALEKRMITQTEHDEMALRTAQQHAEALANLEHAAMQSRLSAYSGALGDLASLMQSENSRLFAIGKAAAIAQAVVDGISSATSAWKKGMAIGGPPVAAAFAGASIVKTGMMLSQLKSAQPSGKSAPSVGGGASAGGGTAAAAPAQAMRPTVSLTLMGDQGFSRAQIVQIAEAINDGVDEGQQPIQIRGRR